MMMARGFDCATKLNTKSASALKKEGFDYTARYLGNSWKTFDKTEAEAISKAGLKLISIFQKSADRAAYFTEAQGKADGLEAVKAAKAVGQPPGTAIYFAVDFDARSSAMPSILAYFNGVKKTFETYKLGIYGSYAVMLAVKGKADYYWQTYAWSNGRIADFIHMHQYENNIKVAGVLIDRNDVRKEPGHWSSTGKSSATKSFEVKTETAAYLTAADAKLGKHKKGIVKTGSYYIFNESAGMVNVTKQQGVPGSWINPKASGSTEYHTVAKGDSLSKIAQQYGITLANLQNLNPQIKNIHLIYPNQKIKVK
ncbi:glycoside hydrolase domain-containing protein [Niallia sp. MER 6]|uniref:glycoside hydrolase domain-containing protein n=1 Tax=Niallia sp. MER 6 TaxID=2939567 RepID=UPI002040C257|nr:glycoside hydrolase domain-containing protein [Niallia sp. MER 6]MCM3031755.1 DUF1906 domain-containing protein [Niallia sp. MER 6]